MVRWRTCRGAFFPRLLLSFVHYRPALLWTLLRFLRGVCMSIKVNFTLERRKRDSSIEIRHVVMGPICIDWSHGDTTDTNSEGPRCIYRNRSMIEREFIRLVLNHSFGIDVRR